MSDDAFVRHRRLLFTVAYEMLGSASDAEDVVQETWLRWAGVDQSAVRDQRAYLVRIVTRQALNRLRTLARRREEYVGEWLPEPVATSPDVAADVELAESLSLAMLTVLETLGPAERAVFVLREVFDTPYDEIAEAVGKSAAAVRQIAHRAREHVAARRPRVSVSAHRATGGARTVPCRHPPRRPAGPPGGLGPRRRHRRRRRRCGPGCSSSGRGRRAGGPAPDQRSALGGLRGGGRLAQRVTRRSASTPALVHTRRSALPSRTVGSPASTSSPTRRSWPGSTGSPHSHGPDISRTVAAMSRLSHL